MSIVCQVEIIKKSVSLSFITFSQFWNLLFLSLVSSWSSSLVAAVWLLMYCEYIWNSVG